MVDWGKAGEVAKTTTKDTGVVSDAVIEDMIKKDKLKPRTGLNLICGIFGEEDTGKSGVLISYLVKKAEITKKDAFIIDIDGSSKEVLNEFYPDCRNVYAFCPLKYMEDMSHPDYENTIRHIRAMIRYVMNNNDKFFAIAIDGLSTLSKYAEYIMRIEKCLTPDGTADARYWTNREKHVLETIQFARSIEGVDRYIIGHSEWLIPKELEEIDMNAYKREVMEKYPTDKASQLTALLRVPQMKRKLHQTIHQRIITKKRTLSDGTIRYTATIDKSKYNPAMITKEFELLTIKKGKKDWKGDNLELFEKMRSCDEEKQN